MPEPEMLPEETVEDDYTLKFKQMVVRRGLLVDFDRDRARVDLGIMPNPRIRQSRHLDTGHGVPPDEVTRDEVERRQ